MHSVMDTRTLLLVGCPIRKSPGQSLFSGSPKLIAASHVLHRLLTPRHPPFALSSLAIIECSQKTLEQFKMPKTHIHLSKINKGFPVSQPLITDPDKFVLYPVGYQKQTKKPIPTTCLLLSVGGGERIRTDGLLRARQALSQLSYTPAFGCGGPSRS